MLPTFRTRSMYHIILMNLPVELFALQCWYMSKTSQLRSPIYKLGIQYILYNRFLQTFTLLPSISFPCNDMQQSFYTAVPPSVPPLSKVTKWCDTKTNKLPNYKQTLYTYPNTVHVTKSEHKCTGTDACTLLPGCLWMLCTYPFTWKASSSSEGHSHRVAAVVHVLDFATWTNIHTSILARAIIIISTSNYAFDCIPCIVPSNA